jgi:ubiquinone/menaquinone biosynthesis C-methylase UbiE
MTADLRDDRRPAAETALERFGAITSARSMIETWSAGGQALALLEAVEEAGWSELLAEGCDLATLEGRTDLPTPRLKAVLDALADHGVVEHDTGMVRLTPGFALLAGDDAHCPLPDALAYEALRIRLAREAVTAAGIALTEEDALVVAKGVAGRVTPVTQTMFGHLQEALPEYAALSEGGRLLDVGCGVAWAMLNLALLHPEGRQVGIELVPAVAEEARRRAAALGVADRVEVRCQDARTFEDPDGFDLAFWAQPFFPVPTRAGTLAMIWRALKPGGVLVMQELFTPPEPDDEAATREFALERLVYESQGIDFAPSAERLAEEAAAAGFEPSRIAQTPIGRCVVMRRSGSR